MSTGEKMPLNRREMLRWGAVGAGAAIASSATGALTPKRGRTAGAYNIIRRSVAATAAPH